MRAVVPENSYSNPYDAVGRLDAWDFALLAQDSSSNAISAST